MQKVIFHEDKLRHTVLRLDCCAALFRVLHAALGESNGPDGLCDAMNGACDLLESISNDLQADIDRAEDYREAAERGI